VSEPPRRYSWEDYLYPANESGVQVLRNKMGLREFGAWHGAERQLTVLRAQELIGRPDLVSRTFDVAHWKGIHHHIFQDVYEWAGEFRAVDISKATLVDGADGKLKQQFNSFAPSAELEGYADAVMGHVRDADMFAGCDRAGVVDGLADSLMWMNRLHPFREGNGRTQRVMAEHIAAHAGYLLDWYRISPEEQHRVMAQSYGDEHRATSLCARERSHRDPTGRIGRPIALAHRTHGAGPGAHLLAVQQDRAAGTRGSGRGLTRHLERSSATGSEP
jgi:cell filamentation protein